MTVRRRRIATRREQRALVPYGKRALPQVYLSSPGKTLSPVLLPEPGDSRASTRLKWLASTCIAAVVGVGVIGSSIYASLGVEDGTGMVSSIRSAGLAAMQPVQSAHIVSSIQSVSGQKSDKFPTSAEGVSTKHIIHDTVVQRKGEKEYLRIKPYARLVATLGTAQPEEADRIPAFNPFTLYSNPKPVSENGENSESAEINRDLSVQHYELEGGLLPSEDGLSLTVRDVAKLMADRDALFAVQPFAMRPAIDPENGGDTLAKESSTPQDEHGNVSAEDFKPEPNTTYVAKSVEAHEVFDEVADGSETKSITVQKGDTLMSILSDAGAERWQAKAIAEAMKPSFDPKNLNTGQEIRFTLLPAPKNNAQMEPVKVSLFSDDRHDVTVARNEAGEFVASDDPISLEDAKSLRRGDRPQRATLYTSFYNAALNQGVGAEEITRLLRVHSYDVDFKRLTHPGDAFEVFFDLEKDDGGQDKAFGEVLYTAMTVNDEKRGFYRFRTPDGEVDFYDRDGNSAKKFLMRKPVKGARFTSGFGMRRHPISRRVKMHTGADWGAKSGTPILAAGSGVVEQAGRKGGNGNYVRIRHANGYKTAYSHLSRYATGLRPGMKVQMGQVIGYVGSTGYSTGPHLHFEVLVNGRFVNPMTIHVPRGRQLTGKILANFYKERNRIDELMQRSPVTTRVAAVEPRH